MGCFLFYNATILNESTNETEENHMNMTYEGMYKKYENVDQPRIIALDHTIDIYPNTRMMKAKTEVIIKNKHKHAIDSIHFTTSYDYQTTIDLPESKMVWEQPCFQKALHNIQH